MDISIVGIIALVVVLAVFGFGLRQRNGLMIAAGVIGLIAVGLIYFPIKKLETIKLPADVIFNLGPLPITNSMLGTWVTMIILLVVARQATNNMQLVPTGLQNLMEVVIEALHDLVQSVTGDRGKTQAFFPLVATIFLFVLVANWLGLVPGFTVIEIEPFVSEAGKKAGDHAEVAHHVPLFRAASTDLNTTAALALISVVMIQYWGIKYLGVNEYRHKFFTTRGGALGAATGIIEFISEVSKLISFSFRLFGNIFAGEVVLIIMSFLAPFGLAIPFLGLEVFVGFIQAFVFAMLTLVFSVVATTAHAHDDGHGAHH